MMGLAEAYPDGTDVGKFDRRALPMMMLILRLPPGLRPPRDDELIPRHAVTALVTPDVLQDQADPPRAAPV